MANIILYSQIGHRPLIWRPVACYNLARWLEDHGYTCQVIEFTHLFSPEDLVEYTKMFIDDSTILIGASSSMWTGYDDSLGMRVRRDDGVPENIATAITELKQQYPKVKTIVGGGGVYKHNITLFDFINNDSFAEDSLLKLADELSEKSFSVKLRRSNFDICTHRFVYKEHDCVLPGEVLPIEWGRGCIFKCPFCRDPNLGKKPGTLEKNIDLMVDEFTEMYEKFGTTSYYFIDETFNADVNRIENLAKVYEKLPFKLEFLSYNRADLLDAHPHTQDILHECGQRGALMGIESFHTESAKLAVKPWSARRGKDFILELQDKWINTHMDCHFIAGFPTETLEDLQATADWLLKTKIGFFWFTPLMMLMDEKKGTWEVESDATGITWPNPKLPYHWKWGDMTYAKAYTAAGKLNRYINSQSRVSMWVLGAFKTAGVDFSKMVNQPASVIYSQTGDFWDHETRLFEMYKNKLKAQAGR